MRASSKLKVPLLEQEGLLLFEDMLSGVVFFILTAIQTVLNIVLLIRTPFSTDMVRFFYYYFRELKKPLPFKTYLIGP